MSQVNNNVSSGDEVPVGEWDAEVRARRSGRRNSTMRRAVRMREVRRFRRPLRVDEVTRLIRHGIEPRQVDANGEDALRFYACLDQNCREMFIASQTMGAWRHSISDIRFHTENMTGDELKERVATTRERGDEYRRAAAQGVTPDTMVTCPQCGTQFRVGKQLT